MAQGTFDAAHLSRLLEATGAHLEAAGHAVAIVVVGGAALALRGWIPRTTHDVDVIALEVGQDLVPPELPPVLVAAVSRVARDYNLPEQWLNPVVGAQWKAGLPEGFAAEIEWRTFRGLRVGLAGRGTLIALKLFAAVDTGASSVHCQDLILLCPDEDELERARRWVLTQDIAPEWPRLVAEVVDHVRARRGHR